MSKTFLEALTNVGKKLKTQINELNNELDGKAKKPVTTSLGTNKILTSFAGTYDIESVSAESYSASLYKHNLFTPHDMKQTRGSGITYSISSGVISVKGTATEWKTIDTGIKWPSWIVGKTVEIKLFDISGTFPASSVMYVAHRFSGTNTSDGATMAASINSGNKSGIRFTCTAVADTAVTVAIYSGSVLDNKFGIVVRVVDSSNTTYPTSFKHGEVYNITKKEAIDLGSNTDYAYLYSTEDMQCTDTQKADAIICNVTDWINAKKYGCAGDGKTDDIGTINAIMSQLSANGGGTIYFPKGTYMVSSTITPPANIVIKGAGAQTVVRLIPGSECDVLNVLNPGVSISDISIEGDYNGTSGNGIVFGTDDNTILSLGQNKYDNISLSYFPECGIKINKLTWVMFFNSVRVMYCKTYGVYNMSSDNSFNNLYVYRCGLAGLYNKGGNNRYSNAKLIYTGYGVDTSVGATGSYGLVCTNCERVQFVNVEVQDGVHNGAKIASCADIQLTNLLLDYNTSIQQTNSTDIVATELTMNACNRVQGNVIFACYNSNNYTTSQLMTVTASLNCTFEVNKPTNTRMSICSNNAIMSHDDKKALMALLQS